MKYMLDTNICIYAMKNKPKTVAQAMHKNLSQGFCISTITLAELLHGVEKSVNVEKNKITLESFLDIVDIFLFDTKAAEEYGKICAYLQRQGTPIGIMDMLIAAHALSQNLTLVTNNVREFERVPNLQIENWSEENETAI